MTKFLERQRIRTCEALSGLVDDVSIVIEVSLIGLVARYAHRALPFKGPLFLT